MVFLTPNKYLIDRLLGDVIQCVYPDNVETINNRENDKDYIEKR